MPSRATSLVWSKARKKPSISQSRVCSPKATCSSKTYPAWARPASPRRWPPRCTAVGSACSSRPICCPPTSSASASSREPASRSSSNVAHCSPTSCSPTRSTERPRNSVRTARGNGGAPSQCRRVEPHAARAVHGHRHPEPGRAGRHVPPPGEPARPVPHAPVARLSGPRRRVGDRADTWQQHGDERTAGRS